MKKSSISIPYFNGLLSLLYFYNIEWEPIYFNGLPGKLENIDKIKINNLSGQKIANLLTDYILNPNKY